jgi:hypothetical protein
MGSLLFNLYAIDTDMALKPIVSRFAVSTSVMNVLSASLSNLTPIAIADVAVALKCSVHKP